MIVNKGILKPTGSKNRKGKFNYNTQLSYQNDLTNLSQGKKFKPSINQRQSKSYTGKNFKKNVR